MTSFFDYYWRSGGISSFDQVPFARSWQSIPHQDLPEVLDADSYIGRMAMYKAIVDFTPIDFKAHTSAPLVTNSAHFLWGYVAQLDWQMRSRRLLPSVSTATEIDDQINPLSWWGRMNFSLCIVILVAAQRALNILPNTKIVGAYIDVVEKYEPAITTWIDVFQKYNNASGVFNNDTEFDDFRKYTWYAHTVSLEIAFKLNEEYFALLPDEERHFALGWCRFVEFFASARFRTDLEAIRDGGAGYLPQEILGSSSSSSSSSGSSGSSSNSSSTSSSISSSKSNDITLKASSNSNVSKLTHKLTIYPEDKVSARRARLALHTLISKGKENVAISSKSLSFLKTCCKRLVSRLNFPRLLRVLSFQESPLWWTRTLVLVWWWIRGRFEKSDEVDPRHPAPLYVDAKRNSV